MVNAIHGFLNGSICRNNWTIFEVFGRRNRCRKKFALGFLVVPYIRTIFFKMTILKIVHFWKGVHIKKTAMKTKKLISYLWVAVFALVGLQGCNEDDGVKIGLLMGDSSQERWQQDQTFFVNKVQELGGTAIVRSASNDPNRQLEQAKELLNSGVDVLVVVPVSASGAGSIVNAAHEAGVKVLAYDRIIQNAPLDFYISFDNVRVGELQASYVLKQKPEGQYVIISGPESDNNSSLFYKGQMKALDDAIEAGDVEVVYDGKVEKWDGEYAYQMMKGVLDSIAPGVDVVIAANDDLANGVRSALREKEMLGDVLLTGQDADLNACRAILAGHQTMTVYKPIQALANTAAIAAVSLAQHGVAEGLDHRVNNGSVEVPSILLDPIPVDKQNMRGNVVADGFHEEGDLFGGN